MLFGATMFFCDRPVLLRSQGFRPGPLKHGSSPRSGCFDLRALDLAGPFCSRLSLGASNSTFPINHVGIGFSRCLTFLTRNFRWRCSNRICFSCNFLSLCLAGWSRLALLRRPFVSFTLTLSSSFSFSFPPSFSSTSTSSLCEGFSILLILGCFFCISSVWVFIFSHTLVVHFFHFTKCLLSLVKRLMKCAA